ncbi:MAG: peptide chain release factor 2 [Phycisphaeraceae bacterium]|nr:peptide chain release factor 2 [Phycisphaeraceae bacterium]
MIRFNYDAKVERLKELEVRMGEGDFWNNQDAARKVVAELKSLKAQVEPLREVIARFEDARLGYQMSKEAGDKDLLKEADEQLFQLQPKMEKVELQSLLSGKHDHRNCFLTISAGVGGTEANDWAEMLFRMYIFYCEKMGWSIEEVDKGFGAEVGIDSVTIHVKGPYAFGYLSCERGTHRLARVSPFNAQGKRQTSFATVEVVPEIEEVELKIPEKDLDIVVFARSSGPGGQNVNKVATAVRITHLPTGIQVTTNTYKEMMQNRTAALNLLMAKLQQIEDEKREREILAAKGGAMEMGWGTQIRSYVFYDNRVKDHRTGHERTDYEAVLRGDIQDFVDAELKRRRAEKEKART